MTLAYIDEQVKVLTKLSDRLTIRETRLERQQTKVDEHETRMKHFETLLWRFWAAASSSSTGRSAAAQVGSRTPATMRKRTENTARAFGPNEPSGWCKLGALATS